MRVRELRLSTEGCGSSAKAADCLCEDRVTLAEAYIHGKGGQRLKVEHNLLMLDCTMRACVSVWISNK